MGGFKKLLGLSGFFLGLSSNIIAQAQQEHRYHHQFSFTTENDSYTSLSNDGYYTNGVGINFQWRKLTPDSSSRATIHKFEAGQLLYNAEDGHYRLDKIDRPITGYLFLGYQQSRFNKREHMWRWKTEIGAIGAASMGRQVQEFIHRWWNIYEPKQWEYQLRTGWGLTETVSWHPQVGNPNKGHLIGFKPVMGASLGNMFTNLMIGAPLLFGRFNPNSATTFWNNYYGYSNKQKEFYFYLYPSLYYQLYNATVQGNYFNKKPEIVAGILNPWFFQGRIGVTYARPKISVGYAVVFENKQSLTQRAGQLYGSVQMAFRW